MPRTGRRLGSRERVGRGGAENASSSVDASVAAGATSSVTDPASSARSAPDVVRSGSADSAGFARARSVRVASLHVPSSFAPSGRAASARGIGSFATTCVDVDEAND
jgi:hypothetical protein